MAEKQTTNKTATKSNGVQADSVNKYLRYISIILVVVFTAISLVTLTLRARLVSPGLYTGALEASGIYSIATNVVEDKATEALLTLERELIVNLGIVNTQDLSPLDNILILVISSTLEKATTQLVESISERINLEGMIQSAVEEIIVNDLAWLRGETQDPKIFSYIPPPAEIEKIQSTTISDVIYGLTAQLFGISNLPLCASLEEEQQSLAFIGDGEILKVVCTSDTVAPLLQAALTDFLPQPVVESFGQGVERDLDRLQIKPVVDEVLEVSLAISRAKQTVLDIRAALKTAQETSYFMILISLPLLVYVLIVTKKDRILTFFKIYLSVGLIIMLVSIIKYLTLSNIAVHGLPAEPVKIVEGLLTQTQSVQLVQSFNSIKLSIISNLALTLFLVGTVITVVSGTPYVILKILKRRSTEPEQLEITD